jgi:hypothetical protein
MKARDVMNRRVTAATPRAIGRDLALQFLSGMYHRSSNRQNDHS